MKLSFLGVTLALVAAFGLMAGSSSVFAQATKTCNGPGGAGTSVFAGQNATCTVTATATIPAGGSLQVTVTSPAGSTVTACVGQNGFTGVVVPPNTCQFNNNTAAAIPAGTVAGTETIAIPANAAGQPITQTATACTTQTFPCAAPVAGTTAASPVAINGGAGAAVAPGTPTISAVNPGQGPVGTTVTVTGTNFVPGATTINFNGTAVPAAQTNCTATTCTVTVPLPAGCGAAIAPAGCNVVVTATTAAGTSTINGSFLVTPNAAVNGTSANKTCTGTGAGGVATAGNNVTCTVTAGGNLTAGQTVVVQLTGPAGATVTSCTGAPGVAATTGTINGAGGVAGNNACAFTVAAATPAGTTLGTETIATTAATRGAITQTAATCNAGAAAFGAGFCGGAANQAVAPAAVGVAGAGANIAAPAAIVTPVGNGLAAANFVKTCTPTGAGLGRTGTTASPIVTTCTITVTAPAGSAFTAGVEQITSDVITNPNATRPAATFIGTNAATAPVAAVGGVTAVACQNGNGGIVGANAAGASTLTCVLPPISVTGPTALAETVTVTNTATGAVFAAVGVAPAAGTFGAGVAGAAVNPPTGIQSVTCGAANTLVATFQLPFFANTATTCTLTPTGAALGPVADGVFQITLVSGAGVLSCDSAATAPATTGCFANSVNTISVPCGTTAPNGTVPSSTCSQVPFSISSLFTNGLLNPTTGFGAVNGGGALNNGVFNANNGGQIVLNVTFIATPGNGGGVGGVNLGNVTINIAGVGTGILVVGCNPSVIPSNGTLASVCTATFASTGPSALGGLLQAGAFLPGTFTFSTPGEAIFDNGRKEETVPCGVSNQISSLGVGGAPLLGVGGAPFGSFNAIAPVAFSCTGAQVLAIGNGAAGDAPINVTYTSAVGGFTAVGSTLIVAIPSGTPRIALTCNPTTISNAGGIGSTSTCVATVTDVGGVPLSGLTGANVAFTVSDPTRATVLACTVGASVTTGIGTTGCGAAAVNGVPSVGTTFANGQAAAAVVANPGAAAGPVTVTATLGVLVPPAFGQFIGSTTPTALGGVVGSTLGTTGLAVNLNPTSLGFGGVVTLPNASSATAVITIAGPVTVSVTGGPVALSKGCNQVTVTTTAGTQVSAIAAAVSPANVVSIFRFNNATKTFQAGYFSDSAAPTDFNTTAGGTETYFICVSGSATLTSR